MSLSSVHDTIRVADFRSGVLLTFRECSGFRRWMEYT